METKKVTRLEVIDVSGRVFVRYDNNMNVDLSLQDDGRTLKVFISEKNKQKDMDYKALFSQLKKLTESYVLIKGSCALKDDGRGKYSINSPSDYMIYESSGNFNEELMEESLIVDMEFDVECEGHYDFEALVSFSSAQIGNYPPPNVEVPAYYYVEHIELRYVTQIDEYEVEGV